MKLKREQYITDFENLELLAKQVVEGFITGLHKSPFHGFSVEFAEHRQYNTGESTRHIDWKLYARTEKLFVKRYEEETNLRCRIIIDTSGSMLFPLEAIFDKGELNKLSFSVVCAAALTEMLKRQRDAFGITLFSDKVEVATAIKSSQTHQRFLFSQLEPYLRKADSIMRKNTLTSQALHEIAETTHRRSLLIIFSDMFGDALGDKVLSEDLISALRHLKHNKHEVVLFHVVDKEKEHSFNYDNRPYRFVDLESGKEIKLFPEEIKEKYKQSIEKYETELKLRCAQFGIDFVEADIKEGFNQILGKFLIKRQSLY